MTVVRNSLLMPTSCCYFDSFIAPASLNMSLFLVHSPPSRTANPQFFFSFYLIPNYQFWNDLLIYQKRNKFYKSFIYIFSYQYIIKRINLTYIFSENRVYNNYFRFTIKNFGYYYILLIYKKILQLSFCLY